MARVHLIHWHDGEARAHIDQLTALGYRAEGGRPVGPASLKALRDDPPDVCVIDLSRLPSHGRDVALGLRQSKATRRVPLLFLEGDPQKVARLRRLLPDAVYATWRGVRGALARALARPVRDPIVPASTLAGYSGTPLPKKLGIKAGATIALVGAPEDFERTLGELPVGATLRRGSRGGPALAIWFLRTRAHLARAVPGIVAHAATGPVWIAWPKQGSPLAADLTQPAVREAGLAAGLVDYKVCAIDTDWSGLLFRMRTAPRR